MDEQWTSRYYREWGLNLIPLKDREKIPARRWQEYQKRRASEEEIDFWRGQYTNFAVVCGTIYTYRIPIKYDPNARCPAIEKWIHEIVEPDSIKLSLDFLLYFGNIRGTDVIVENDEVIGLHFSDEKVLRMCEKINGDEILALGEMI